MATSKLPIRRFSETPEIIAIDERISILEEGGTGGAAPVVEDFTGTVYVAVEADTGKIKRSLAAQPVVVTLPDLPVNTRIIFAQWGDGRPRYLGGAGQTVRSKTGSVTSSGRYAEVIATVVAPGLWWLSGDLDVPSITYPEEVILTNGTLHADAVFARASVANYTDLSVPQAGVDVPRWQTGLTPFVTQPDAIRALAQLARLEAAVLRARPVDIWQGLIPGLNAIVVYGQSDGKGAEAYPHQTRTAVPGAWMIGLSEHQSGEGAKVFAPIGGVLELNPLIGTTVDDLGTSVLSDAAADALNPIAPTQIGDPPLAVNIGESFGVTLAQQLRKAIVEQSGNPNDPREIVLINIAMGGATVTQLGRSDPDGYFDRWPTAMEALAAIGAEQGKDVRHALTAIHHGESAGATLDPTPWMDEWNTNLADAHTYGVLPHIPDQQLPAMVLWVQVGGMGIIGNGVLTIAQATVDLARERGEPVIPRTGTAKALHQDVNGQRQTGYSAFRAVRDILLDRHHRAEVYPWREGARAEGNEIFLPWTAEAQLEFGRAYVNFTPTDFANRGIAMRDDAGSLTHRSSHWVDGYGMRIVVNRPVVGSMVTIGGGYRNGSSGKINVRAQNAETTGIAYKFGPAMRPDANNGRADQEIDEGDYGLNFEFQIPVTE